MRQILLLRGINLGPNRRVPMAELRELLEGAGFEDVATYVQSGNVVLTSPARPTDVADRCSKLVSQSFGFEVPVIVRSAAELAKVIEADPLGDVVTDPKLYQVTFLDKPLPRKALSALEQVASADERLVARSRELYAWHPEGVGRSKLAARLAGKQLGVTGTARNWKTVLKLREMAAD